MLEFKKRKGLSSWLFSKLVMFSFLVIVFGIMTQMIILLNERSYSDSTSILCLQLKEATQGIINSRVIEIENIIPIPEALPEKSESAHHYYVIIKRNSGSSPSISFAITKGTASTRSFSASRIIYLPNTLSTNVDYKKLEVNSGNYSYIVIKKNESGLNFYGCEKFYYNINSGRNEFKTCIKPGGTIIHDLT